MPLTEYFRNVVLDMILGQPVFAALHTDAGEISGGSYSRKQVRYAPANGGKKENSMNVRWQNVPRVRESDPISTVMLYDSQSGGNALWPLMVPEKKTANAGDDITIDVGELINTLI